jgi:alkylhydroperoxidase/carboxymuconolactone decarboxylase family protein YurZ
MSITETANRNHEKWFPNHTSTLKATDPEFIELFDNFAFDEVLSHGDLDDRTRLMTILAALIAAQALGEYKVLVGAALNLGVTPVEVKEILYQAVASAASSASARGCFAFEPAGSLRARGTAFGLTAAKTSALSPERLPNSMAPTGARRWPSLLSITTRPSSLSCSSRPVTSMKCPMWLVKNCSP